MKTLVASPICERKLYSLDDWAAATVGHHRLMVIEEGEEHISDLIRDMGITVMTYRNPPDEETLFGYPFKPKRYNEAWRTIIGFAELFEFSHILSLESDNIPEDGVDIVELMESNFDEDVDFLVHLTHWRDSYGRPDERGFEMGCTMAKTETWRRVIETIPQHAPLYWAVYQTADKNPKFNITRKLIEETTIHHLAS